MSLWFPLLNRRAVLRSRDAILGEGIDWRRWTVTRRAGRAVAVWPGCDNSQINRVLGWCFAGLTLCVGGYVLYSMARFGYSASVLLNGGFFAGISLFFALTRLFRLHVNDTPLYAAWRSPSSVDVLAVRHKKHVRFSWNPQDVVIWSSPCMLASEQPQVEAFCLGLRHQTTAVMLALAVDAPERDRIRAEISAALGVLQFEERPGRLWFRLLSHHPAVTLDHLPPAVLGAVHS